MELQLGPSKTAQMKANKPEWAMNELIILRSPISDLDEPIDYEDSFTITMASRS